MKIHMIFEHNYFVFFNISISHSDHHLLWKWWTIDEEVVVSPTPRPSTYHPIRGVDEGTRENDRVFRNEWTVVLLV